MNKIGTKGCHLSAVVPHTGRKRLQPSTPCFQMASMPPAGLTHTHRHMHYHNIFTSLPSSHLSITVFHITSSRITFSLGEQSVPATLLSSLLLRAGIESNPGPPPSLPQWPCGTCGKSARYNSIQCTQCCIWIHNTKSCSKLLNKKDFNQVTYRCPSCTSTTNPSTPPTLLTNPSPAPPSTQPSTPPHPNPPTANPHAFNLLQLNINGLKGKANELNIFLRDNNIKIAALQETKLDPLSPSPTFKNYTVIRKDRNQYGGGLAFLIHHSVQYHNLTNPLPNDPHLEALAIEIPTPDGNPHNYH